MPQPQITTWFAAQCTRFFEYPLLLIEIDLNNCGGYQK